MNVTSSEQIFFYTFNSFYLMRLYIVTFLKDIFLSSIFVLSRLVLRRTVVKIELLISCNEYGLIISFIITISINVNI